MNVEFTEQSPEEIDIAKSQEIEEAQASEFFDYFKARKHHDEIIASWGADVADALMRRKERYIDIEPEELRQSGDIREDETFIPDRVIDSNIVKENSEVMAFLNAGYRLGIFECLTDPTVDARRLELEVTKGLTYNGWYREFYRVADGAALHKMDYLEVVFDETKPLHVGFEHVGFDRCFYNRKVENPEDSERLIRLYELPVWKLESADKTFGFDKEQIDIILQNYKERRRNEMVVIYKEYFKYNGIVYISWFCKQAQCNAWLKAPEELRLGITHKEFNSQTGQLEFVDSPIDCFPIFSYLYRDDEQIPAVDHKGRGFLDCPQQEANTSIITAFVNGTMRASNVYASPKTDDGESAEMKQLDVLLEPGGIYAKPLDFWNQPYPDPIILQGLNYLSVRNSEQNGKMAAAVSNRKDARKTAEELRQASQQEAKITSTGLATFSEFLRGVLNFAWQIIQSQALQENKIRLCLIAEVNPTTQQTNYVNDVKLIENVFDIRPAGDTDIIEAQQLQTQMMQDWPVIQTTPLKDKFLADFIKLRYPKKADEYLGILQSSGPKQLVAALGGVLKSVMQKPDELKTLGPADMQNLVKLEQEATQYLAQP